MAESSVTYAGDGSSNDWTVTFGYLKKSHVKLYIDDVEDQTFTWLDSTSIAASSVPASGAEVVITRTTPRGALVYEIPDSGTYKGADLNNQALQALYIAAEGYDSLSNTIALDTADNKWDADSKVIKNVVDPVDAQDVATKNYTLTGDDSQLAAAAASATAAAASETTASSAASTASTAASNASTSASTASTAASNASTSASTASTAATTASNAQGYAEEWAITAEDTLVSVAAGGNGTTEYSAYHWAQKAGDSATTASAAATAAAASVAGIALPSDPRDANELLRGEEGIAMNFMSRDFKIIDYNASTLDDAGLIAHNAPFTMTTNTSLTVTNREGGSEALSANEVPWDHDVSGDATRVQGVYHAGSSNHYLSEATIGSTFKFNTGSFTIFLEFEVNSITGTQELFSAYATAPTTDGVIIQLNGSTLEALIYDGSSLQCTLNLGTAAVDDIVECAVAHRTSNGAWGVSNLLSASVTDASVVTPATFTDCRIGYTSAGWTRRWFMASRAMPTDEIEQICGL